MGNLVRDKIITTKVFVFLDETSYFRYYIFSDWHCSFVKRNKKILHLLCIASPVNNFHCQNKCNKWGYKTKCNKWGKKLQVCRSEKELANFYRNLEIRMFHVRQANLSGPTFCFRKTICMTTCGNKQKNYKAAFWDDETTHLKQLTSFSPLTKCYVSRGRGLG